MRIRIATWNLDRSGARNRTRWALQLAQLDRVGADILVLTEAHEDQPVAGMRSAFSSPGSTPYTSRERAVAIWSRWDVELLPVSDPRLCACVRVALPAPSAQLIVYGTVIPYADDGVRTGQAVRWERHRLGAAMVARDCAALHGRFSDHVLTLAGDFNMNFDGTRWYGLNEVKGLLQSDLEAASLECRSNGNLRIGPERIPRASVDHIWATCSARQVGPTHVWYGEFSDHNGVAVDLELPVSGIAETIVRGGPATTVDSIQPVCPFCAMPQERVVDQNEHAFAVLDRYPVAEGHTLIISRRHAGSFFELSEQEHASMLTLLRRAHERLRIGGEMTDCNVGINDGPLAGQTVKHVHLHLIPRRADDGCDPRGGVRWVIPAKAKYWPDT